MTDGAGSVRELRRSNVRRVVAALADGPCSQSEIAAVTGLSAATVSNLVAVLRAEGTVTTRAGVRSGRRAVVVELVPAPDPLVGVEIGRDAVRVVALLDGVLRRMSVPTGLAELRYEDGVELVGRAVTEVCGMFGRVPGRLGVALPGIVSHQAGRTARFDPVPPGYPLAGWAGRALAGDLRRLLGADVWCDNDANAATLGEAAWGAAADVDDVIYLELSEGIGGGLLLGGQLYRGPKGNAGELGHCTANPTGILCWCGGRGCLETLVGEHALVEPLRRARRAEAELTVRRVVAEALAGDGLCARVLAEAGRNVAIAVAPMVALLGIADLVVGGVLADAGDLLLEPLRRAVGSYLSVGRAVRVRPGRLGRYAAAVGCLAMTAGPNLVSVRKLNYATLRIIDVIT
jgi:predicted NBD/HSP70 family sugar kinase/biotin operon repressor